MGLRDRLSANYFIPLVAGTTSAAKAGLLAPPEVYAPALDAGGGLGSVGAGDGGNQTPDDADIAKPTISYYLYTQAVLQDAPILYWRLGDAAGTTALDQSGNGRHGAYAGTVTLGQAGLVQGLDASVRLSSAGGGYLSRSGSETNLSRNFSVEIWYKPAASDGGPAPGGAIFGHGNGGYYIRGAAGDILQFLHSQNSTIATGTTTLVAGAVYHIVLTMDAVGNWKVYLNGDVEMAGTTSINFNGLLPFLVGVDGFSTPNSEFNTGWFDEVAVYGSALSQARIQAHYGAGLYDLKLVGSAFSSSSPGETHVKSRWVLEYRGTSSSTAPSAFVVYDSGPVTSSLIEKSLIGIVGQNTKYAAKVRYKGSLGGWSPWSDYVQFTTGACPAPGLQTYNQHYIQIFDPNALTTHTGSFNPPAAVAGWTDVKGYLGVGQWDDRGWIEGNFGSRIEPTYSGSAITYDPAPDIQIHTGNTAPINYSVTNMAAGGCRVEFDIVWTGYNIGRCAEMPTQGPTDDPPPPVFVPPQSQPPAPPPLPGVPPPQQKFANVLLDLSQSTAGGRTSLGNAVSVSLSDLLAEQGYVFASSFTVLHLVFQNTGNAPGCISYALTPDNSTLTVHDSAGIYTEGSLNPSGSLLPLQAQPVQVCVDPGAFKVSESLVSLDYTTLPFSESHTVILDLGDGAPMTLRIGFDGGDTPA